MVSAIAPSQADLPKQKFNFFTNLAIDYFRLLDAYFSSRDVLLCTVTVHYLVLTARQSAHSNSLGMDSRYLHQRSRFKFSFSFYCR